MASPPHHVVVVGAGVSGLTAAHRLASIAPGVKVTVLEATDRAGGKVQSGPLDDPTLDGFIVDEGADAFLRRVPWALELCTDLGLEEELVSPTARQASLWRYGALRPIPNPNVLGIPLDPRSVDPNLLDRAALARLAEDGRPEQKLSDGDLAVGTVVRSCVGDQVFEHLVDPLLGGINAGRADHLSCAVMPPQLLNAARSPDGLLAVLRKTVGDTNPSAPIFATPSGGMGRLIETLLERLAEAGIRVATDSPTTHLERNKDGWLVHEPNNIHRADAVILAAPSHVVTDLIAPHAPSAGDSLGRWEHASVVLATFVFDRLDLDVDYEQSGFLVGRDEGLLMTACSFVNSKWAHFDHPERTLLRVSCGRIDDRRPLGLDDTALVEALRADLATTLGVEAPPTAIRVRRWPRSLVQFPVGHIDRLAEVDNSLVGEAPGLLVAGAIRYGVGIPACIRSGNEVADAAVDRLT